MPAAGESTRAIKDLDPTLSGLAFDIARDASPKPTLRIGALGHRLIDAPAQAAVLAAVSRLLKIIRDTALEAQPARTGKRGEVELAIISPLAEGADRLIAKAGLAEGFSLGAILPFSSEEYEASFDIGDPAASRLEFRSLLDAAVLPKGFGVFVLDGATTAERRDASFLACAKFVSHWTDLLLVILSEDQFSSQTARTVEEAEGIGRPILAIDPARPDLVSLRYGGKRMDGPTAIEELKALVSRLLKMPTGFEQVGSQRRSRSLIEYGKEVVICDSYARCDFERIGPYRAVTVAPSWIRWCSGLNNWIETRLWTSLGMRYASQPRNPAVSISTLPLTSAGRPQLAQIFFHHHRADVLASAYSELLRSAQIMTAALGLVTVICAAISTSNDRWTAVLAGLELGCLLMALGLVWTAHRQRWLDRWLDYRLLAEVFRYSKFLLLAGQSSPFADTVAFSTSARDERAWTRHYAEQVLRAQRLAVPGRERVADEGSLSRIREYCASRCVDEQIAYHEITGLRRRKIGELLRTLGYACSVFTILCVGMKFGLALSHIELGITFDPIFIEIIDIGAVVAPGVTAAVLALRAFGEHDIVARRSLTIVEDLKRERAVFSEAKDYESLGTSLLRVTRTLMSDVDGWLSLFAEKHLE